jgi:hypothetical protein
MIPRLQKILDTTLSSRLPLKRSQTQQTQSNPQEQPQQEQQTQQAQQQ